MDNSTPQPTDQPQPQQPVTPPAPVAPEAPAPQPVAPTPAPATPEPAPAEPAPAPASGGGMKKILFVEDDDGLAEVYLTRLDAEGFDVKRVPNGEDALSTALAFRPDLILLDAMMPQVNGFDVLDILRNTPDTANVKIIMLTALSQQSDKDRATSLGADDYLVKSQVVIADVIDKIKHHLGIL
jgi:CheY-like chemotaxis protein